MRISARPYWLAILICGVLFCLGTQRLSSLPFRQPSVDSLVAMPPILLLGLYGGDRYLAADIESARLMGVEGEANQDVGMRYYHMAHEAISVLNPCHEDNYYVANAILGWGGAQDESFKILARATVCRFWDEWPPFYYGFNRYYLDKDGNAASRFMQIAADRKGENQILFQRLAITLKVGSIPDSRQALRFLQAEQKSARDARLRRSLGYRIGRLEGLIQLEDAAVEFEKRTGRKLTKPQELLQIRLLQRFPDDPLGIGYTFNAKTGRFGLRSLQKNGN